MQRAPVGPHDYSPFKLPAVHQRPSPTAPPPRGPRTPPYTPPQSPLVRTPPSTPGSGPADYVPARSPSSYSSLPLPRDLGMLPLLGTPRRQLESNLTLNVASDSFSRDHCSGRFSLVSEPSVTAGPSCGAAPAPAQPSPGGGAPMPPGWIECVDAEGTPFYFNQETQESRWVRPGVARVMQRRV